MRNTWDWESISERLHECTQTHREHLRIHAKVMLELIPEIREKFHQFALKPFLSHDSLCLSMSERKGYLSLYGFDSDAIEVHLLSGRNYTIVQSQICTRSKLWG